MKKSLFLGIVAGLFCCVQLMAAVQDENNPVIPYSIDFTQTKGKPDEANAEWIYSTWTRLAPEDYSKGFWMSAINAGANMYSYDDEGKSIRSGIAAIAQHMQEADMWLVSPGLLLEKGKSYEIAYTYKRFPGVIKGAKRPYYMTEKFEIGIGDMATADNLKQQILDTYDADNNEYETGKSIVTIKNDGTYYIGIHVFSDAPTELLEGMTWFCLGSFSIKETVLITPNPVTELSVTPDSDKKLSAHLSWKNPVQWSDGKDITDTMDAEIYRNDELIKTLTEIVAGSVFQYDDTEIPQAGLYEYAVCVKVGDKYSFKVKSNKVEIGNLLVEVTLPYRIDLSQSAPYGKSDGANSGYTWEKWLKLNPADITKGVWKPELGELTDGEMKSGICAYCSHTDVADAWVVSPYALFEKGKAYAITYTYKKFPNSREKFEIGLGMDKTAEALRQNIIATYEVDNGEYRTETMVVQIEETREYCIGIHCISEVVTGNSNLCLGSFSIEETTVVKPSAVTGTLVRSSNKEMFAVDLSWTNPTKGTMDEVLDGNLIAKIFRGEELIATLLDLIPGENVKWSDKVSGEGRYTYSISIGWRGIYSEKTILGSCNLESWVPMKISDLTGSAKEKEITLTWTNPSVYSYDRLNPTELPLPEKMYIEIYRSGILVETLENQNRGVKGEFKDILPAEKKYTYWIICRLEDGAKSTMSNTYAIDLTPAIKPSVVTDLKAEADSQVELKINVSWINPTKGTKDENLSGKQFKALIFKGDELVETLLYLVPGEETEWSEQVEKAGTYTYSVAVELDEVYSDTIDVFCTVNYFKPAVITDFSYRLKEGKVLLQWKASDSYENGNELKDKMSINLYCNDEVLATMNDQLPGSAGEYEDELDAGEKNIYYLTVVLANGALSEKSKTIEITGELGIQTGLIPSNYYDTKSGILYLGETADVAIYNVAGVCVFRKVVISGEVCLKELPSGTYFIEIGEKRGEMMKIVK